MTSFRDLPAAVVANCNTVPPLQLMPLVADPLCLAHPMLQALPSIAIPTFACPRSAIVCAYWLVNGRFHGVPVPHAMTMPALIRFLDLNLVNFPVSVFMHNPLNPMASIIVPHYGVRRSDGYQILYIPPGPLTPNPHFAFVQQTMIDAPWINAHYVYYGTIPIIDPLVYWHAEVPSPIYYVRQALGRACLCRSRCSHEPLVFSDALTFSFSLKRRVDYHVQCEQALPPFLFGPQDSLHFVCASGEILVEPKAVGQHFPVTLDNRMMTTGGLGLRFYRATNFRDNRICSVLASGTALAFSLTIATCAKANFFSNIFKVSTDRVSTLTSTIFAPSFSSLGLFSEIANHILVKHTAIAFACTTSIFSLALVKQLMKPLKVFSNPLPMVRTWMPPTLSRLPYAGVLKNRLAAGPIDQALLRASLRRYAHEHNHEHFLHPSEIDLWIEKVCTEPAMTPIPMVPRTVCATCRSKARLKRRQCVQCRRFPVQRALVFDGSSFWVGMLALFPEPPSIPLGILFRDDVVASYKGVKLTSTTDAMYIYNLNPPPLTPMGKLCGPMFLGFLARCYPRGIETTIVAFAARIGVPVANTPDPVFWNSLYIFVNKKYFPLTPSYRRWSESEVLHHQKDSDKRRKLEQCYNEMDVGDQPSLQFLGRFGAFSKLEKHVSTTMINPFDPSTMVRKPKRAPRLINSPHPHVNAHMSIMTIPLLKWLKSVFHQHYHIFYAGCSSPAEINEWLSFAQTRGLYTLEDDVSMMDASQSEQSQDFMLHVVRLVLSEPDFHELMRYIYLCRDLRISQSGFRARIKHVNASGVPLTSFLNSLTTAFVRIVAVVYAYTGLDIRNPQHIERFHICWTELIHLIAMAVAGDDGAIFLPPHYMGVETFSKDWMSRYVEAWTFSGFDVGPTKIKTHTPSTWRLTTFLAMRPVWSGNCYEFGVEIARRLKTMFWMLDKTMHPTAWGRGVAISLLRASRHVPVLRDICEWYLRNTQGAITHIDFSRLMETTSFTNPDSTFYQYLVIGDLTERTIQEFLMDYDISISEYSSFQQYLDRCCDVHINMDHIVLRKILSFE